MIEFCTKRRMILSTVGLGILTVLILILEETLTSKATYMASGPTEPSYNLSSQVAVLAITDSQVDSDVCLSTEDVEIVKECEPCTAFEMSSNSLSICSKTGLKELLRCKQTGRQFYKSCPFSKSVEKTKFYLFEGVMLVIAVLSSGMVKFRMSLLEKKCSSRLTDSTLLNGHM